MGYLLNYRNWEALYESQLNESYENVQTTLTFSMENMAGQFEVDKEDEDILKVKDAYLQKFKEYNIIFDDRVDIEDAAWLLAGYSGVTDANRIVKKILEPIKLNVSPADKSKLLTHGTILPDKIINPTNVNGESEYENIIKFNNNYILWTILTGNDVSNNSFVKPIGLTGVIDANGSFSFKENKATSTNDMVLLGTTRTSAAQSQQAIKTTTWTIPAEGKDIVLPLPGTMFETNKVEIRDSSTLDAAINELTTLIADKSNKIKSITIESSASGDRGVGGVSGYPAGTKPGTYPLGKAYIPKTAQESGNAGLAFGRAESIKAKLGNIAPTTVKALIQDGGDAAQYAKLIVTIEKVDKPEQALSKQELENILLKKSEVTDFKALNSMQRVQFFK